MRTLFEISDDLFALAQILDEEEGEVRPETEEALDAFFAELGDERDRKIDNYCALIRHFEALGAVRKEEAKRLSASAQVLENKAARLKARLLVFFKIHGLGKISTDRFTVGPQKAGGKAPLVLDPLYAECPDKLPEGLKTVTYSPDKEAIRRAVEAGEADGIAYIAERGEFLSIR